jgi:hypothetical protein
MLTTRPPKPLYLYLNVSLYHLALKNVEILQLNSYMRYNLVLRITDKTVYVLN